MRMYWPSVIFICDNNIKTKYTPSANKMVVLSQDLDGLIIPTWRNAILHLQNLYPR